MKVGTERHRLAPQRQTRPAALRPQGPGALILVFGPRAGCPTLPTGTPYHAWPVGTRTLPVAFAFSASSYDFREKKQYRGLSGHYIMEPTGCFHRGYCAFSKTAQTGGHLASVPNVQTCKFTKPPPRTWKQTAVFLQMGHRAKLGCQEKRAFDGAM